MPTILAADTKKSFTGILILTPKVLTPSIYPQSELPRKSWTIPLCGGQLHPPAVHHLAYMHQTIWTQATQETQPSQDAASGFMKPSGLWTKTSHGLTSAKNKTSLKIFGLQLCHWVINPQFTDCKCLEGSQDDAGEGGGRRGGVCFLGTRERQMCHTDLQCQWRSFFRSGQVGEGNERRRPFRHLWRQLTPDAARRSRATANAGRMICQEFVD